MPKNNLLKILYTAAGVAFILVLPALFAPAKTPAQGEVLGAFTNEEGNVDLKQEKLQVDSKPAVEVSLIGPLVVGPVLTPEEAAKLPPFKYTQVEEPEFQARAALIYDVNSGETLLELNPNKRVQIASLTKLMTAIIAMEDPDFLRAIVVTPEDQMQTLPILGLKEWDTVMPLDLVKAMLVGSANDAAWALANHLPNKETFVAKMNAKAKALGMMNTSFGNPVGFDDEKNYSTADDIRKLTGYALERLPYDQIWKSINFSFKSGLQNTYAVRNTNDLVFDYANIKSIKTGVTPGAMQNMVSQIQNARGKKIVVIILGAEDRNIETVRGMNYVFDNFTWR